MKTVVLQTFRRHDVPDWMTRCMTSVRSWAAAQGYEYEFQGDESFALCGDEYLAAVGSNKQSITNLVRLEWIRLALAAGYDRAIWLDADTFVFDPARFSLDVRSGYACGKEVWIDRSFGCPVVKHQVHNAALVFAGHHKDLDLIISLIRYIAATRQIETNFQVGVNLLSGLQAALRFPLVPSVGMFGPDMIGAIARHRTSLLRLMARENGFPFRAANLGLSLSDERNVHLLERAMYELERSRGEIINCFLGHNPADPLTVPQPGLNQRPRFGVRLPQYLIRRALTRPIERIFRRRKWKD